MNNTNSHSEKYWFHNIKILTSNYQNIFPRPGMTYAEKVNSLVRMSILAGIVLSLVYYNHLFLYIPIMVMLLTYVLFLFREQELKAQLSQSQEGVINNVNSSASNNSIDLNRLPKNSKSMVTPELLEKFENYLDEVEYAQPEAENPFMNAMPFDKRNRAPASRTVGNPVKQAEVEVSFDHGTFRDVNDIFDKNNGKRQFFTMPWTTYPNDQGSFANWLYKTPPTCKEGNGAQCVANYYTPLNRNMITPGVGSSPN